MDYIAFTVGARMATAGIGRAMTTEKTPQRAAARASAIARMLTGANDASIDRLSALVCGLLDAAGLTGEQRIDVLGGAFVAEAVRAKWADNATADDAHAALRIEDSELSDAVEAVAQALLGRVESRAEARRALAELDRLLADG